MKSARSSLRVRMPTTSLSMLTTGRCRMPIARQSRNTRTSDVSSPTENGLGFMIGPGVAQRQLGVLRRARGSTLTHIDEFSRQRNPREPDLCNLVDLRLQLRRKVVGRDLHAAEPRTVGLVIVALLPDLRQP